MRSEKADDRLSRLPEEVVSHILSLMPTKFAVRSSILSRRWRYSWMYVTNFDFDDIDSILDMDAFTRFDVLFMDPIPAFNSFIKFVDRVLEFCKPPQLQLFRLHISYLVPESTLSTWIDKAVNLNVQEIDIRVDVLHLPLSLCTCKTLTKLTLHRQFGFDTIWDCPCPVNLPCLKTLGIIDVFPNALVNAFKLIRGCPVLEDLSLQVHSREGEDGDYIFNIPTLKRLELTLGGYVPHNNKVFLNVPKLEHLFVGGILSSLFVMEDVSSLEEATLKCGLDSIEDGDHLLVELFKGLSGVKSLSVQSLNSLVCFPWESCLPDFPNMKHLELKCSWNPVLIHCILERCPQLTCLCIEHLNYYWFERDFLGAVPNLDPTYRLTNLTTVRFKFAGQKCVMDILEYMLGNAEVLKTVIVTWHNVCNEEEMRFGAQLLKVPRASPDCEITFIGSCSPYTAS